jgi:hypothetical protein
MFKSILKATSAIVLAIIFLLVTSYIVTLVRGLFDEKYLSSIHETQPINILGLIIIILVVKLPSIIKDFRPEKGEWNDKMIIILIVIGIFIVLSLFAGELIRVFLDKVIPTVSQTLFRQVGIWESIFLVQIFNLIKEQFD